MEINLPAEVAEIITRNIESGEYHSPTEVIVQALWLFDGWNDSAEEKLEKLRRAVQAGRDDPGPAISGKEFFAQLREEMSATQFKGVE